MTLQPNLTNFLGNIHHTSHVRDITLRRIRIHAHVLNQCTSMPSPGVDPPSPHGGSRLTLAIS